MAEGQQSRSPSARILRTAPGSLAPMRRSLICSLQRRDVSQKRAYVVSTQARVGYQISSFVSHSRVLRTRPSQGEDYVRPAISALISGYAIPPLVTARDSPVRRNAEASDAVFAKTTWAIPAPTLRRRTPSASNSVAGGARVTP